MIPGIKDSLTVKINDHNQVIIQANVVVNYGVNVGKTVNKIQNNIINAIDEMMGFRNVKVNVNVNDIKILRIAKRQFFFYSMRLFNL